MADDSCNVCGAPTQRNGDVLMECTGGRDCSALYCSKECQREDWNSHKLVCTTFQSNLCRICNESGKEGDPVYRACSCRGDKGFGHLSCFVSFARENEHNKDKRPYERCPLCEEWYNEGEVQNTLAKAFQESLAASGQDQFSYTTIQAGLFFSKTLLEQNKNKAAYECMNDVLNILQAKFGEDDFFLLDYFAASAALNMVNAACRLGRFEEAIEWLERLDSAHKTGRAKWHNDIVPMIPNAFAAVLLRMGKFDEAHSYAVRAVETSRNGVEEEGKKLLSQRMITLALACNELGKRKEAVTIAKDAYKLCKKAFGSSNPATRFCQKKFVELSEQVSDPESHRNTVATMEPSKRAFASLLGLSDRLDGTVVEVDRFDTNLHVYETTFRFRERLTVKVKPANLVFEPGTHVYIHSLEQDKALNLNVGVVKLYSSEDGKFVVKIGDRSLRVKPENLLPKHQKLARKTVLRILNQLNTAGKT